MRFFSWHLLLITFWIVFEISFLQILFVEVQAPLAILALLVSMSMVFSFNQVLGFSLLAIFLFDLSRAGTITPFFLFALPLVLITGFVAHRFFPESRSIIHFPALLFFVLVVALYEMFTPFFTWPAVSDLLLGILIFPLVFFSVYRLEGWLVSSSMLEFRGLRQSTK